VITLGARRRADDRPCGYLSALLIWENSALSRVPRLVSTATKTIAIKEDMSAYSIAVAPASSRTNVTKYRRMKELHQISRAALGSEKKATLKAA
jgi:hypothetical protein